jgi:WD40 repeat protein
VASESSLFLWRVRFHTTVERARSNEHEAVVQHAHPHQRADPVQHELATTDARLTVSGHSITCCGCAFSPNGLLVATADFGGNVFVWHSNRSTAQPLFSVSAGLVPIRSLAWHPTDLRQLFVGHTDGTLSRCLLSELASDLLSGERCAGNALAAGEGCVVDRLAELSGAVTCLRWSQISTSAAAAATTADCVQLAVTTSEGDLYVYDVASSSKMLAADVPAAHTAALFRATFTLKAHSPAEGAFNPKFGSLRKYAEIWSCAWSPDNLHLATCSEDQTTCR